MPLTEQIEQFLSKSSTGLTAREIARACKVTKTEVNKILYSERSKFIPDGSRVPIWKTVRRFEESTKKIRTQVDRISPPKVLEETFEIEIRGFFLKMDVLPLERSRNEDFYSVEIKSPGHILITVTRLFEDEAFVNQKETSIKKIEAWQVLLVAQASLEYLYQIGLEPQEESRSSDISLIVRKLYSQISSI